MKTSKQWWESVKMSEELMNDWLIKQYRGEVTAAHRIRDFAEKFVGDKSTLEGLNTIANQEAQHAEWVHELLESRGIVGHVENAEDRYWRETLPVITSAKTGAAIGAHAEAMRLERIRVICDDEATPHDIRETFQRILSDEEFHELFFRTMAGPEAMKETAASHTNGLNALGLES